MKWSQQEIVSLWLRINANDRYVDFILLFLGSILNNEFKVYKTSNTVDVAVINALYLN